MNETLIVTRFYRMDDAIWGDYSMSFEGGLNVRHFVKMLREIGDWRRCWSPTSQGEPAGFFFRQGCGCPC